MLLLHMGAPGVFPAFITHGALHLTQAQVDNNDGATPCKIPLPPEYQMTTLQNFNDDMMT